MAIHVLDTMTDENINFDVILKCTKKKKKKTLSFLFMLCYISLHSHRLINVDIFLVWGKELSWKNKWKKLNARYIFFSASLTSETLDL